MIKKRILKNQKITHTDKNNELWCDGIKMASIACYRWFQVEFDFIFIFINDDCDWTQRNDKYAHCMWAHFQHRRVESVVWRSCGICELHHIIISMMMHFTLSILSLTRSSNNIFWLRSPHECMRMLISIFSNCKFFQAYFIFLIFSFKEKTGEVVNFTLENLCAIRHYFIIKLYCCCWCFCSYFIEWTINWN